MQHFWYQIKMMFCSPATLFWSVAFPVILGGLFYCMFGNLDDASRFAQIPVGIVTLQEDEIFIEMLEQLEAGEGASMFQTALYEDRQEAESALEAESVQGVIILDGDKIELVIREGSIRTSIMQTFVDQYLQNKKLIENTAKTHPERVAGLVEGMMAGGEIPLTDIPLKGQDKDPYTQYFYALLAMACLIASSVGVQNGLAIQADLSAVGARRNIAPAKKMKQVLVDFAASLFVYCVLMTGVLIILVFGYHQSFGSNVGLILLATWVGSFVGLAGGTMLAVVLKGSKSTKEGLAVAFFMVSSFLSGLQWGDIIYLLEKHCPIINRVNPATLMVNAYKSLSVFGDYRQYAVNLATLLLIGAVFLAISIFKLRRCRYASV